MAQLLEPELEVEKLTLAYVDGAVVARALVGGNVGMDWKADMCSPSTVPSRAWRESVL